MEPSQSCAPKTKLKSITNGHKNDEIESIQKPRGHEEDRASFPNQITHKVSTIHQLKSTLKGRTGEERHRGGGLEEHRIHGQVLKAAINLTQVNGYLYPRDRPDRYAGPVRPVPRTGQTGWPVAPPVHDLIRRPRFFLRNEIFSTMPPP